MKNILLILLLCVCFNVSAAERSDIQMIDKHISVFADKLKKKGFSLFGSGGAMMDNIKKVNLDFDLQKKVEIDEARQMLVELTEDFLTQINSDEKLKPYLSNYPFNHLNTEISISFKDNRHVYMKEGIACVMTVGNNICFSKSNDDIGPLVKVSRETYDEALQKIKQKKVELSNQGS